MADAGGSRRRALTSTTAEGGAGRCLSDLSDDLLRHILFLAPDRDGARTAVLSRRWRGLWRTCGALHLDSRSLNGGVRGADEALAAAAAAHGPIRRLTFSIAAHCDMDLLIAAVASNPAARRVEELQIEVKKSTSTTECTLSLGSLLPSPSETLRVLRIIGCSSLTLSLTAAQQPPPGAFLPMLVELHLQDCSIPLADFQSIVDAASGLSALHFASTDFSPAGIDFTKVDFTEELVGRLVIPAVSALVLVDCRYRLHYLFRAGRLKLDVPRLQHFRYRGHIEDTDRLSLKSANKMVHVDLHLTHDDKASTYVNDYMFPTTAPTRELFWRFIQCFNTAKLLKLRIDYFTTNDLALFDDKARRDELLGGLSFGLLERLELEAEYKPGSKTSMVALADLLRCCPMVRDLRIKLTKQDESPSCRKPSFFCDIKAGVDFDKSVSGFRKRKRTSLAGKNDDSYESLISLA